MPESPIHFAILADRAVVRVSGEDAKPFLQGLVSNDVNRVTGEQAVWAAFLTPQGKYLFDFPIAQADGGLVLDVEAARAADLAKRLSMFKLRSKVAVEVAEDWAVAVAFGDGAAAAFGLSGEAGAAQGFAGGVACVDPRLAEAGVRIIAPRGPLAAALNETDLAETAPSDYDAHRLALGLPDGTRDMTLEKATLLENGFDELNGVDWTKGCYMGQELTARTKYRGLVKKRLVPVVVDGALPAAGSDILDADGKVAGEVKSGQGDRALALMRLERMAGPLSAGEATLTITMPDWIKIPEPVE